MVGGIIVENGVDHFTRTGSVSLSEIKVITFDFWGTLYFGGNSKPLRMKRMLNVMRANGYDITEEQLQEADYSVGTMWEHTWRVQHRTLVASEWLELLLERLDTKLPSSDSEALAIYFNEAIFDLDPPVQLVEHAPDVLARLALRYRLGIISDTGLSNGEVLRRLLQRDGIIDHFSCLSFSDETGVSKPHRAAFQRTLDCLDAQPQEAVHIGDLSRTDIAGAREMGMRAVRFTGVDDDGDDAAVPSAIASNFIEFEQLVYEWDRN